MGAWDGIPEVKLILTDIDGTILPYGQSVVSDRAIAAFHRALNAGIRIGPATGRDVTHVLPAFQGDGACVATALATNGMQVYLDGALIHEERLPLESLARILAVVRARDDAGMIVFSDGVPSLMCGDREVLRQSFPRYAEEALEAGELPDVAPVKANVFVDGGLEKTREVFECLRVADAGIDVNLPMPGILNLTPAGWSKASGIDLLCEALSISLDQVVVFGDGGNDVEMLAHVPSGVAVGGCSPEAADAAHWHIGRCEDGAVVEAIELLSRGDWPFYQGAPVLFGHHV